MDSGNEYFGPYKKGGTVKKTGKYLIHKGERVVPAPKKRSNRTTKRG